MNIHLHIANVNVSVHDDKQLSAILERVTLIQKQVKTILMTQEEAVQAVKDLTAQVGKVSTEVQKLIDAAQNQGNVSPELADAITAAKAALQGLDDLNADATETPEGEQPA
jgi:hypothetical protein